MSAEVGTQATLETISINGFLFFLNYAPQNYTNPVIMMDEVQSQTETRYGMITDSEGHGEDPRAIYTTLRNYTYIKGLLTPKGEEGM